jgi:hypothetical protein
VADRVAETGLLAANFTCHCHRRSNSNIFENGQILMLAENPFTGKRFTTLFGCQGGIWGFDATAGREYQGSVLYPAGRGSLSARKPKRDSATPRYGTLCTGNARRGDRFRHEGVSGENSRLNPKAPRRSSNRRHRRQ